MRYITDQTAKIKKSILFDCMFFQVFCLLMGKHLRLAVFASYNKLPCQNEETTIERQVAGAGSYVAFCLTKKTLQYHDKCEVFDV